MSFHTWLQHLRSARAPAQRPQGRRLLCERLETRALLAADFSQLIDPNPSFGNQFGHTILPLASGNVVVTSPFDDYGAPGAGAVYLFNGRTGALISALRGATANDNIGLQGVTEVGNGNFVVRSTSWDNGAAVDAGAVTWGSGTTGVKGVVSAANSLIGSSTFDFVGIGGVTVLTNGNYVVISRSWNGTTVDEGAVTWGNGATGVKGLVSAANSLVGSSDEDSVGDGVTALANGNYVVHSPYWDNGAAMDAGASTWGSGTMGVTGVISAANSLVGNTAHDEVGSVGATALTNGNYVVKSPKWNGAAFSVGAATWGNGATGVKGAVSAANSLVGSTAEDRVGDLGVTELTNGNYVVSIPSWDDGATANVGAATWGSGTTGVKGVVSAANSLVGSTANDQVGFPVIRLTNGNYVVQSQFWDDGATANAGAATWGSGATGIKGVVSAANSLVGSTSEDAIGNNGVTALSNGNYVVASSSWDNGATADVGAATWANGATGAKGAISETNSLIGSTAGDLVGLSGVTTLKNGNYVVSSLFWDNGAASNAGAATWGNGTTGVKGVVSAANSLVGSTASDLVGSNGATALANGSYIVGSQAWDNGATADVGAATWGSGTTGVKGVVSAANSLVGSTAGDGVGSGFVLALTNGNYVALSSFWDNGAAVDAGAVTWGSGTTGVSGKITGRNSVLGIRPGPSLLPVVVDDVNGTFFASFADAGVITVRVGSQFNGFQPAPAIRNFGGSISYTENANPLRLSSTASVSDVDSPNFASGRLIVKLVAGGRPEDRLTILTGGNISTNSDNKVLFNGQIIGTFSGGVGTTQLAVNFNAKATPDRVQQLLRQIAYRNVSDDPRTTARTVRMLINDGDGGTSAPVSKQINVTRVNDAPVLAPANGGTVGYRQNGASIALLSTATVTDPDSANFAGGELLVRIISGGNASNRLLIGVGFYLDGNLVKRRSDGLVIGSRNADGGVGTTRLEITFNASATRAIAEQLVRAIRFRTVGGTSTVQRVVEFSVTDGDGGASNKVNKTVNVS